MIAVAHGKEQRVLRREARAQTVQGIVYGSDVGRVGDGIAGHVPAAHHQGEVVEAVQLVVLLEQGLDHAVHGIVHQHQHMAGFQRRAAAHHHPGRDALRDGFLRGAHKRLAALGGVIAFQIQQRHQPHARTAGGVAFNQNEAVGHGRNHHAPLQVVAHGLMNAPDALWGFVQVAFGQNQVQRGGMDADEPPHILPVFGLGGELVAGHTSPFRQARAVGGQKQLSGIDHHIGIRHINTSLVS